MVQRSDRDDFEHILNEPPNDAIYPNPQRHVGVFPERKAHDRKTVEKALGPEGGEEGGYREGDEDGADERFAGCHGPEEALLRAARKKSEEI